MHHSHGLHHQEVPWIWLHYDDVADAAVCDSTDALGQEKNITQQCDLLDKYDSRPESGQSSPSY